MLIPVTWKTRTSCLVLINSSSFFFTVVGAFVSVSPPCYKDLVFGLFKGKTAKRISIHIYMPYYGLGASCMQLLLRFETLERFYYQPFVLHYCNFCNKMR